MANCMWPSLELENCKLSIKPGKDEAANSTRNVVFKEVLLGCVAGAQLPQQEQQEPSEAPMEAPMVVEDIDPEWLAYDSIIDNTDDGLFQEEFGPPCQRRTVPPPSVTQPRLSQPILEGAGPLLPTEIDGERPQQWGPISDYEMVRENNIQECREQWYEIFGVEYPNVE